MPALKQPWLCIQCTGNSSGSLSDTHTHFHFCSVRMFSAHDRRIPNLHEFFCHDRGFWAASSGRLTHKFHRLGGTGEECRALQNWQDLVENLGLASSFSWSPLRGNILAIFKAVLIKIRLTFFSFVLFCLLVCLLLYFLLLEHQSTFSSAYTESF